MRTPVKGEAAQGRPRTGLDGREHLCSYISMTYEFLEDKAGRGRTALNRALEARVGIEPAYTALQAAA